MAGVRLLGVLLTRIARLANCQAGLESLLIAEAAKGMGRTLRARLALLVDFLVASPGWSLNARKYR
jgi:hypothetical protein